MATFALDYLLARGIDIREVVLLHLAPTDSEDRLHRALMQVQREFKNGRYGKQPCTVRAIALRDRDGQRLVDMNSRLAVDGAWRTVNQVIGELKGQNREVHVCVSGGRRLVGLLAMSVAALHFRAGDRLWHLYTPDKLRQAAGEGRILHAPPDEPGPYLLEVPIMPGSETFPMLRQLLTASPEQILAAREQRLTRIDQKRCQQVWEQLTKRQREVLHLFAKGQSPQDVAQELSIVLGTVSSHQHAIYNVCRDVWSLEEGEQLDYHWLERQFGTWRELQD